MLVVLLGGARSGKSTAALRLAADLGDAVTFVATAPHIDGDDELAARIEAHRAERPAEWRTIEAETDLADAIRAAGHDVVVVDCLTVWLGNLIHAGLDDAAIEAGSSAALSVVADRSATTIVVSNEVGLGIVPADPLTRRYRDLLGRLNQQWVAASDRALLLIAGRSLLLDDVADGP